MKKIILSISSVVATFCLMSCAPESKDPKNEGVSKGIIAYTPQTLSNPFFNVIAENIREEARQNGYEVLVVDPDMDVKKQSDQIDDFIAKTWWLSFWCRLTVYRSDPP